MSANRAREIFMELVAHVPPEQWEGRLAEWAGENPELHRQVARLLAAHRHADSFLEHPASPLLGTADDAPASAAPGESRVTEQPGLVLAGRYKLLEQIGEGGMGSVWMAQQNEPVKRLVAVKLIKPGMDSKQVLARFELERQALALMGHPNIAQIIDGGATASGRPYFVMELVRGVPITAFCDKNHLPAAERLKLFVSVCNAIQHAHHKGVIHRDIKPSNVLVTLHDGVPVVKIIDFGLAKATQQKLTEKTLFTSYGQMIGTPAYMSPEQAEVSGLDIDTRSDIYSLGVLLYELLTGTTPIDSTRLRSAGYAEMQRLIREEEPPRPSTRLSSLGDSATVLAGNRGLNPKQLERLLAGDLDWIVMKSLEKDRNRRYSTPGIFAEDVERYLRREAIFARPPSATYRMMRFAQRHRGTVVAVTAVALALFVGTVVATWQAVVATRAKQEALVSAVAEKAAKETAEVKEAETRAVLDFVEDKIFAAARPKGREGGLGPDVTLRAAIDAALPFVEKGFQDQPLTEARLRMTLGASFWYLGDGKAAAAQYEPARAIYTRVLGADHYDTLVCLNQLGISYGMQGRTGESVRLYEEILPIIKAKLGPDDTLTLQSMNNLGMGYYDLGEYEKAMQIHKEALEIKKAKYGPGDRSTLLNLTNLANVYHRLGRYEEALKLRLETLELQKANLGREDHGTLMTAHNIGANYGKLERYADALRFDEETLALRTATLGRDHPDTLTSMWSVAKDLIHLDRSAEAVPILDECLQRAVGKRVHSNFPEVADLRLRHFEKAKDVGGCRTTAELWEKQQRTDVDSLYKAAVCRAVTAKVLHATDKSPDAAKQADAEADRAMAWLHKAVAAGYKKVANLKEDKDLDTLRNRADFMKLLVDWRNSS